MSEVTIGGERLGSGKKMKAYLHNYERSTHNLSYIWRSTMAAGTLVPFMSEVALPGDTFDIDLECEVLTHPTIGPLFGSYKVQLDMYLVPVRLYHAKLHMNHIGIGMKMSTIKLPQIFMQAKAVDGTKDIDNQQINPSSIYAYLGMRGLGVREDGVDLPPSRNFNAIPLIAYWDIYKNYYANKQEEIGVVIHQNLIYEKPTLTAAVCTTNGTPNNWDVTAPPTLGTSVQLNSTSVLEITTLGLTDEFESGKSLSIYGQLDGLDVTLLLKDMFGEITSYPNFNKIICKKVKGAYLDYQFKQGLLYVNNYEPAEDTDTEPQLVTFPLKNIDDMRIDILRHYTDDPFLIDDGTYAPYGLGLEAESGLYAKIFSQEGLGIKTYQSDLFNNWVNSEWITGVDGIQEVTRISTTGDSFTIDELNLAQKVYNMLNRIAISGGTYDDWLDAVYTENRTRSSENPMYMGGLIKELVFQEVISNAATETTDGKEPLGTLAGRGKLSGKHKGGKVVIKVDEPSYIMGIVSLTPRVDYSQGNKWDTRLETMNDFHKPALDEIGYQNLITDEMAWWDTKTQTAGTRTYRSAGKQPAWINYMTAINRVFGNFAIQSEQMYMTLNRRYDMLYTEVTEFTIKDLTTYIDPVKFNHIFADTRRDAQNFWTQIGVNITARRKMSAKIIPNL